MAGEGQIELWAETETPETCSVCGALRLCVRVVDADEQVYVVAICGRCLAVALEGVTDMRWINQYDAWMALRAGQKEWRKYKTRRIQ